MKKTPISLIVGLGNPGAQYEATRHNAGQWFIHHLAEHFKTSLRLENKFKAQLGKFKTLHGECLLLVPETFMNLSGQAVGAVARFYKIPPEAILVAHDELDLATGTIRLKFAGGHGGHNGLRDIMAHLNSPSFHRLRIGIGHPGQAKDVSDYVLSRPSVVDKNLIEDNMARVMKELNLILAGDIEKAMKELHTSLKI